MISHWIKKKIMGNFFPPLVWFFFSIWFPHLSITERITFHGKTILTTRKINFLLLQATELLAQARTLPSQMVLCVGSLRLDPGMQAQGDMSFMAHRSPARAGPVCTSECPCIHTLFFGMFGALCSKIFQREASLPFFSMRKRLHKSPSWASTLQFFKTCLHHVRNFYVVLANISGRYCSTHESKGYHDLGEHPHWSHMQVIPLSPITQRGGECTGIQTRGRTCLPSGANKQLL